MKILNNNLRRFVLTSMRKSWLLAFLIITTSFSAQAKKDSLFLKPNILIEYERGPWEGPSGGERKYKRDNNYKRFCNEHYLYTGWSEISQLERNWLVYPDIQIRSGYSDQLFDGYENNVNRQNRRFYQSYGSPQQNPFGYGKGIILKTEIRIINGYSYTFQSLKLRDHTYGYEKEKWTYNRTAWLDTTFSDGTFLQISATTHDGSFNFLANRIEKLVHIKRIPTSEVDRIQHVHFNRTNLYEALDTIYSKWKRRFNLYEKKQLSCTSADMLYPMVMEQMSMESVVSLLSDFRYDDLADSIMRIHHDFLFYAGNRLLALQKEYDYSMTKEHGYYQLMAHGMADISDMLNYMNKDSVYTFLDTLDMYQTIRGFTAYHLQRYMEQHDQKMFEEETSLRFLSDVEHELCRQYAIQNLQYHDDKMLYSKKVSESKSRKIFLIAFDDPYFSTPTLVIFSRQKDNTWKSQYRKLNFNPTIDGKAGMYSLQNYLVVPGEFQCMVLDSREGKNDVQILEMDSAGWNAYKQILVVAKPMTDSPTDFGLRDIKAKSNAYQHNPEAERQYPRKRNFEYEDYSKYSRLALTGDSIYYARKKTLKPQVVLFYQPFTIADLNKNGSPEIYTYTLCNGVLLQSKCFSADDGELKEMDATTTKQWLLENEQFYNLLNFSLIGNQQQSAK